MRSRGITPPGSPRPHGGSNVSRQNERRGRRRTARFGRRRRGARAAAGNRRGSRRDYRRRRTGRRGSCRRAAAPQASSRAQSHESEKGAPENQEGQGQAEEEREKGTCQKGAAQETQEALARFWNTIFCRNRIAGQRNANSCGPAIYSFHFSRSRNPLIPFRAMRRPHFPM